MAQVKTASGYMSIEVNVTCPHCDTLIDLMNPDDVNGAELNDCGDLLKKTCPSDGNWGDACASLQVDEVVCSHCEGEFNVRGVEW